MPSTKLISLLRFVKPRVAHYDGTTNPKVFLSYFKYVMMNHRCTPIHMCEIFPKYLMRSANEWFNDLLRESISSFRNLVYNSLIASFNNQRRQVRPQGTASKTTQRDEWLNDYMTQFTTQSIRLQCSSDKLIILVFQEGLRIYSLYQELCRFPPSLVQDMWNVTRTFATTNDAICYKIK